MNLFIGVPRPIHNMETQMFVQALRFASYKNLLNQIVVRKKGKLCQPRS
jgi:hypothetical protein